MAIKDLVEKYPYLSDGMLPPIEHMVINGDHIISGRKAGDLSILARDAKGRPHLKVIVPTLKSLDLHICCGIKPSQLLLPTEIY